jgi:hypothetical protein
MLHEFVTANRTELIKRCGEKAAKRSPQTPAGGDHGVPLFLQQLVEILRIEQLAPKREREEEPPPAPAPTEIGRTAALHGVDLLNRGFTVDQVVHGYGDVCQAVTGLAVEQKAIIDADEFRTLNRCLDNAIADAVTAYASGGDRSSMSGEAASERRRLVNVAIHTFSAIQTGNVALTGATATLHATTLFALRKLLDSSPPEISPGSGTRTLSLH